MKIVGLTGNYFVPDRLGAPSPYGAYYLCKEYWDYLNKFEVLPWYMPYTSDFKKLEQWAESIHGLVLTGGFDIPPGYYNQPELDGVKATWDEARTVMELRLLDLVWKRPIPILGICLGMQMVNVYRGGSLFQDLPVQCPDTINHSASSKNPNLIAHQVKVLEDSALFSCLKRSSISVNSSHHQAVRQIGTGLKVSALAEDGTIEAIESLDRAFIGVQWHPESLDGDEQGQLLAWLMEQMQ